MTYFLTETQRAEMKDFIQHLKTDVLSGVSISNLNDYGSRGIVGWSDSNTQREWHTTVSLHGSHISYGVNIYRNDASGEFSTTIYRITPRRYQGNTYKTLEEGTAPKYVREVADLIVNKIQEMI